MSATSTPQLLIAGPIETALAELTARAKDIHQYAPNSDAGRALQAAVARLEAALVEARTADCWIGVDEAREIQGLKSREAVTAQARRGELRAHKNEKGVWLIDPRSLPRLRRRGTAA